MFLTSVDDREKRPPFPPLRARRIHYASFHFTLDLSLPVTVRYSRQDPSRRTPVPYQGR